MYFGCGKLLKLAGIHSYAVTRLCSTLFIKTFVLYLSTQIANLALVIAKP